MKPNVQAIIEIRGALREMLDFLLVISSIQVKQLEVSNAPQSILGLAREVKSSLERAHEAQGQEEAPGSPGDEG